MKKEKRKNSILCIIFLACFFLLNSFFFSFDFHRFCQSGFYVDFFLKKFGEVFVRNIFIYGAQFFGEKYMIEYLTKRFFEYSI